MGFVQSVSMLCKWPRKKFKEGSSTWREDPWIPLGYSTPKRPHVYHLCHMLMLMLMLVVEPDQYKLTIIAWCDFQLKHFNIGYQRAKNAPVWFLRIVPWSTQKYWYLWQCYASWQTGTKLDQVHSLVRLLVRPSLVCLLVQPSTFSQVSLWTRRPAGTIKDVCAGCKKTGFYVQLTPAL